MAAIRRVRVLHWEGQIYITRDDRNTQKWVKNMAQGVLEKKHGVDLLSLRESVRELLLGLVAEQSVIAQVPDFTLDEVEDMKQQLAKTRLVVALWGYPEAISPEANEEALYAAMETPGHGRI